MSGKQRRKPRGSADLAEVETLFAIGTQYLEANDLPAAEGTFLRVIQIAPGTAAAHVNLGVTHERRGSLQEAEACYRRGLSLGPGDLQVHLNLGALLVNQKRLGEAGKVYGAAMERFPASAALWSNLGVLHACLNDEAEAERCCRQALALDATFTKARFNLSYLLLRQGRLEEGWPALEARPFNLDLLARIPGPRWQGESLLGKALLIGCEGGHGDMIQFSRYASILKGAGAARIGIVCHPPLKRLFAALPGVDVVVALGETIPSPDWDFWTLPQSLPLHCGTRLDSIPASIPYLHAPEAEVLRWRSRLLPGSIRVGLTWRGNPRFENDPDRSLPGLQFLTPLAAVEGVRFIQLQKGLAEESANFLPLGRDGFDPGPWLEDFADMAALVSNLDLVITVDTATAHLAGALGRPCWVLLPHYKTDWRWFKDREDSPWYPGTMRLFRQPDSGDWSPVITAVTAALQRFVQESL